MSIEVERSRQQGKEGDVGAEPDELKVHTKSASKIEYVTHLSRWRDEPFTVDKRLKKSGGGLDRNVNRVVPKLTPQVKEHLTELGIEFN